MKILRIAPDLYPSVMGGIPIHVHEMSKAQAGMGHDVTVFSSRVNGELEREQRDGYEIRRFKPIVKVFGNSIMLNMFRCLLNEKKDYDVIHAHSHLFFTTNLSALIRKMDSSPLIITNHGLISQTPPIWFSELYNATLGKWTFNNADSVICYTIEEKDKLIDIGVKSTIRVIHNGINSRLFSPTEEEENLILWVGRFLPGKGVEYLIEAFSILSKNHSGLKLLLVGDGPQKRGILEKAVNLGVRDKISIKSFVPNEEMPTIYRGSKVFVLPSLSEGVPRTILEAMSCEVPVVSTDLPQIRGLVSDCGFMVPRKDPVALAEAVDRLLSDESLRKKFGINGRDKIKRNYTWQETVENTVELYKECVCD